MITIPSGPNVVHFTVTTEADVVKENDGVASLREVLQIISASTSRTREYVIEFDSSVKHILLTQGELVVPANVYIVGAGSDQLTIDAQGNSRVFNVTGGRPNTSAFIGLTITNGDATKYSNYYLQNGGGVLVQTGYVDFSDVVITGNKASEGGGLYHSAGTSLEFDNVVISNNSASSAGGGLFFAQGISGNVNILKNSTISGNTSHGFGGAGITAGDSVSIEIDNSTISDNTGVVGGISSRGTLVVKQSTISGNTGSQIGGIEHLNRNLEILNSTITNNTGSQTSGVVSNSNPPAKITSTIIAGNNGGLNLSGPSYLSGGHNLIGNSDGVGAFVNGLNGDIVGTANNPIDPKLAPLANNGGPTKTHLLLGGSPAFNTGSNLNGFSTEQRGNDRSVGQGTDIGATEAQIVIAESLINGDKADDPNQPTVKELATRPLNYTYTLNNPGEIPLLLSQVKITDDNATPNDSSDDWIWSVSNGTLGTNNNLVFDGSSDDGDFILETGETWRFSRPLGTVAKEGIFTSHTEFRAATATQSFDNPAVSSSDSSTYQGLFPVQIDLKTLAEGQDADNIAAPLIVLGDDVLLTYTLTNTGIYDLSKIRLVDPSAGVWSIEQGRLGSDNKGITLDPTSDNGDLILNPGETWRFTSGSQAGATTKTNTATVSASTDGGNLASPEATGTDSASYRKNSDAYTKYQAVSLNSVLKGGEDGTYSQPVPINVGDPIDFLIQVGNYTFNNYGADYSVADLAGVIKTLRVKFDNGTPNDPSDDLIWSVDNGKLGDDIQGLELIPSSDRGGDLVLGDREAWLFRETNPQVARTGIVKFVGVLDFKVDVVTPNQPLTRVEGSASNSIVYEGLGGDSAVGITFQKLINKSDADTPDTALRIVEGSNLDYTFTLENISNVALDEIFLEDPGLGSSWRLTNGQVSANGISLVQGDTNGDLKLQLGEKWILKVDSPQTAQQGLVTLGNKALVTAGISNKAHATASDSAYYQTTSALTLEKSVNNLPADTVQRAVGISVGAALTYTYALTNNTNQDLRSIEIIDDNGTPGDTSDDFHFSIVDGVRSDENNIIFSGFSSRVLGAGQTWSLTVLPSQQPKAQAGIIITEAVAKAVPSGELNSSALVTSDLGIYNAGNATPVPGIDLEKMVNGVDADTQATAVTINLQNPVNYTFSLANTGTADLNDIKLEDPNLGLNWRATNGTLSTAQGLTLVSGDTNGDLILQVREKWLFEVAPQVAKQGLVSNTATATAGVVGGGQATDSDAAYYQGTPPQVGVLFEKFVNGQKADDPSSPVQINIGSQVQYTYTLTNVGQLGLGGPIPFSLLDDNGTPANATDNLSIVIGSVINSNGITLTGGDTNSNNILDTGETWTLKATPQTAKPGLVTNKAVVSAAGTPLVNDTASYVGTTLDEPSSAVNFEKLVNGKTADNTSSAVALIVGDAVNYTFTLDNTGNVDLTDIAIADTDLGLSWNATNGTLGTHQGISLTGGDTNSDLILQVGEKWAFTATPQTAQEGSVGNTATVTASVAGANPVTQSDAAYYQGNAPLVSIDFEKLVNGQTADTVSEAVSLIAGAAVNYTFTLKNTGNQTLNQIAIADTGLGLSWNASKGTLGTTQGITLTGGDANNDLILQVGETWAFTATPQTAQEGTISNSATATAGIFGGTQATDSNSAYYQGNPRVFAINFEKLVNGQTADSAGEAVTVVAGETLNYTFTLRNTGNQALNQIAIADTGLGFNWNASNGTLGTTQGITLTGGDTNNDLMLQVGETWSFAAPPQTAVLGAVSNSATATAGVGGGNQATASDSAYYQGTAPVIALDFQKLVNGNDADSKSKPLNVEVGSPIHYTFTLKNTGNAALNQISLSDPDLGFNWNATGGTLGAHQGISLTTGDTNNDLILQVGEIWLFTATDQTAQQGLVENTASITAGIVGGNPIQASDAAYYLGNAPLPALGLTLEKFVNGQTADDPNDPVQVNEGSSIIYTYKLTNTGSSAIGTSALNLSVVDDNATPSDTSDDFGYSVGGDNLTGLTLTSGDTNQNTLLDPGEVWTLTAPTQQAKVGLVTNTATAKVAFGAISIKDTASYQGIRQQQPPFAVTLEKFVNGQEADDPNNPVEINEGAAVNYTYTLTNTGSSSLGTGQIPFELVDDNGTPNDNTDDLKISVSTGVTSNGITLVSGDDNGNNNLDSGETWTLAASEQQAKVELVTNTAKFSLLGQALASDTASYQGIGSISPSLAITLEKKVNGDLADNPNSPLSINVGSDVAYTYEITNTGTTVIGTSALPLQLIDDNATPSDTSDDFGFSVGVNDGLTGITLSSGDDNGDRLLDPGETWTLTTALQQAQSGLITNIATAKVAFGAISIKDTASYQGVGQQQPTFAVTLEKFVNGQEADDPNNPVEVTVGSPITYTYVITNTGTEALGILNRFTLRDDNGTPRDTSDDLRYSSDPSGGTTITLTAGDTNNNGIFDPGETWTLTAPQQQAKAGLVTNQARITAEKTIGQVTLITRDSASYKGVEQQLPPFAVTLEKFVNGQEADVAEGTQSAPDNPVEINEGAAVNYTYTLTNTGSSVLGTGQIPFELVDDNGTPLDNTDDLKIAVSVDLTSNGITLVSGDDNGNNNLDPGETWNLAASTQQAKIGIVTNTAKFSLLGQAFASDTASYYGVPQQPTFAVSLEKFVNGQEADDPNNPVEVTVGSPITYTYVITNTGTEALGILNRFTLRDDNGTPRNTSDDLRYSGVPSEDTTITLTAGDTNNNGIFDTGETWTLTAPQQQAKAGLVTNQARITAEQTIGQVTLIARDSASYQGVEIGAGNPSINFEAKVNDATADTEAEALTVTIGDPITYSYTIANTGNTNLGYVSVSSGKKAKPLTFEVYSGRIVDEFGINYTSGDNGNFILEPGEIWVLTAEPDVAERGLTVDTATVQAALVPFDPNQIKATDSAYYLGTDRFGLTFDKFVNGQATTPDNPLQVSAGNAITYTYTIKNNGSSSIGSIALPLNLVDDNGTPNNTSDDLTLLALGSSLGVSGNGLSLVSGDANNNKSLDPGETWTINSNPQTAKAGLITNTAELKFANQPSIVDTASYLAKKPIDLSLEKTVNGVANTPATPLTVSVGDQITYTYTITNNGLNSVGSLALPLNLVDDNGTPNNTSDDLTLLALGSSLGVSGNGLSLASGDTNNNKAIDPGETWTINSNPQTAKSGLVTNTAELKFANQASVTDTASYQGIAVYAAQMEKFVNGRPANDPNNPVPIKHAESVVYTYQMINTGIESLGGAVGAFALVDDNGTPIDQGDDLSLTIINGVMTSKGLSLTSGDANNNGLFDPGELWTITSSTQPVKFGTITNTAQVKANGIAIAQDGASYKGYFAGDVLLDWTPNGGSGAINLNSNGTTPVAILGSNTFNVTNIDVTSLRADDDRDVLLSGGGIGIQYSTGNRRPQPLVNLRDVNGDGYQDLVVQFNNRLLGSVVHPNAEPFLSEEQIYIYGRANSGQTFFGTHPLDQPLNFV